SDTIFVRGVTKVTPEDEITELLGLRAIPVEVDLSERTRSGSIWAKYPSDSDAQATILELHQRWHRGSCISARFELGLGTNGKRIADRTSHNTKIRRIHAKSDTSARPADNFHGHHYSNDCLSVGGVDYPFPSGTYLSRLVFLTRKIASSDPLLNLITDPSLGNKYAKELSEAMAMCDAVQRAVKMIRHTAAEDFSKVRVFVLGDGVKPLCAACLCLHFPDTWEYHSIDPLMDAVGVGPYFGRFFQHKCLSQDFSIPPLEESVEISIVVACHSHAPLSEFLSRMQRPVIVVTMPCCADYSKVESEPMLSFDDFEVYSAMRKVHIYNLTT
ncbi:unnamed protein product, partial [Ectocarpus fasciculatus]